MIGNFDQIQQVEKWNYEKTKLLDEIKNLSNQVKSLKNENESLRALRFEIPMISKETDD